MEHVVEVHQSGLSKSQVGDVQAKCGLGVDELREYLEKDQFKKMAAFVADVLGADLTHIGVRTTQDRLDLLCELFDFSRKGEKA